MRISISTLFVAFLLTISARQSSADILMSYNATLHGGGAIVISNLYFSFGYVYDPFTAGPKTLFGAIPWTNGDAGKTVTVSSDADDPNWSTFVSLITDGSTDIQGVFNNPFGINVSDAPNDSNVVAGVAGTEAAFLFGNRNDPRIDLHGSTIDSASITVNSISVTSPGSDPNHDGIWTDGIANVTFTVMGEPPAPEPTSLSTLAFASLLALRRRR
jgi:hypothetical protein